MNFEPSRALLLLFFNSMVFLSSGYIFYGRIGLFLALLLSLVWNYLLILYRHPNAIEFFNANKLKGRDPWRLLELIRTEGEKLRMADTEIFVCQSAHPLFLISTANTKNAHIILSQTLIDVLTPRELEALMILGLVTGRNRLRFFRRILDRMALNWMTFGNLFNQLLPFRHLHLASKATYLIAWIHLKIAYPATLQAQSDQETSQIIDQSRHLASALWKLNGILDAHPMSLPETFSHLSILSSPQSRHRALNFTMPIELRLRSLVGYFPI